MLEVVTVSDEGHCSNEEYFFNILNILGARFAEGGTPPFSLRGLLKAACGEIGSLLRYTIKHNLIFNHMSQLSILNII